jgi:hypothetical protein
MSTCDEVDRTVLPIGCPRFKGVVNRKLRGSQPDWGQIGRVKPRRRPERPAQTD